MGTSETQSPNHGRRTYKNVCTQTVVDTSCSEIGLYNNKAMLVQQHCSTAFDGTVDRNKHEIGSKKVVSGLNGKSLHFNITDKQETTEQYSKKQAFTQCPKLLSTTSRHESSHYQSQSTSQDAFNVSWPELSAASKFKSSQKCVTHTSVKEDKISSLSDSGKHCDARGHTPNIVPIFKQEKKRRSTLNTVVGVEEQGNNKTGKQAQLTEKTKSRRNKQLSIISQTDSKGSSTAHQTQLPLHQQQYAEKLKKSDDGRRKCEEEVRRLLVGPSNPVKILTRDASVPEGSAQKVTPHLKEQDFPQLSASVMTKYTPPITRTSSQISTCKQRKKKEFSRDVRAATNAKCPSDAAIQVKSQGVKQEVARSTSKNETIENTSVAKEDNKVASPVKNFAKNSNTEVNYSQISCVTNSVSTNKEQRNEGNTVNIPVDTPIKQISKCEQQVTVCDAKQKDAKKANSPEQKIKPLTEPTRPQALVDQTITNVKQVDDDSENRRSLVKERRRAERLKKADERRRKHEEEVRRLLVAPKDQKVRLVEPSLLKLLAKDVPQSGSNQQVTQCVYQEDFPQLGQAVKPAKGPGQSKVGPSAGQESVQDSPISRRAKMKQPIKLELAKVIKESRKKEEVTSRRGVLGSKVRRREEPSRTGGNLLDSSCPIRRRGKVREKPKRQALTALKKIIMKDRELRKLRSQQDALQSLSKLYCFNKQSDDNAERTECPQGVAEAAKAAGGEQDSDKPEETDNLGEGKEKAGGDICALEDAEDKSSNISPYAESVADSSIEPCPGLLRKHEGDHVMSDSKDNHQLSPESPSDITADKQDNTSLPLTSTHTESAVMVPNTDCKEDTCMAWKRIHSRTFREYCDHSLTPEIHSAASKLLKDLLRFQDRAHQRDPDRALARRRYVVGLREVKKFLVLRKVKLLIIAPNLEKVELEGGINDIVNEMKQMATEQNIPYVFALNRRKLGYELLKKVPVSCVGVMNYEGTEKNVEALLTAVSAARQQYQALRVSLECPAKKEVEIVSHPEPETVRKVVIDSMLSKLWEVRCHKESPFLEAIQRAEKKE